jgi:hypothetical protein
LKIVYVPVFRAAISYAVTLGRRWSLLDHMLLVELASARRSLAELSIAADLPERVVIESLINLLPWASAVQRTRSSSPSSGARSSGPHCAWRG